MRGTRRFPLLLILLAAACSDEPRCAAKRSLLQRLLAPDGS